MSSVHWIVYEHAGRWFAAKCDANQRVAQQIELDAEAGMQEIGQGIATHLHEGGIRGEPILLALDSARCLSTSFPMDEQNSVRDPNSLAFALEENLPISAENFAADFIIHPSIKTVLGVAVETAQLEVLLNVLEKNGIEVRSLTALAMLALQNFLTEHKDLDRDAVLWQHDKDIELFEIHDRQPRAWRVLDSSEAVLRRELQWMSLQHERPLKIASIGVKSSLSNEPNVENHVMEELLIDHGLRCGKKILAGRESAWLELRRHSLAPRNRFAAIRTSLGFATISAVLCLVVLSLAFLIRAARYQNMADTYTSRQQSLFSEIFPGQPVPVGVESRLQSEFTRLSSLAGQSSDVPAQSSSLELLHHVLSCLPAEMKFHLAEIQLEKNGDIVLDGEVQTHGDAGRIALALEQSGFQVDPPQSEQLGEQVVTVRINASLAKSSL